MCCGTASAELLRVHRRSACAVRSSSATEGLFLDADCLDRKVACTGEFRAGLLSGLGFLEAGGREGGRAAIAFPVPGRSASAAVCPLLALVLFALAVRLSFWGVACVRGAACSDVGEERGVGGRRRSFGLPVVLQWFDTAGCWSEQAARVRETPRLDGEGGVAMSAAVAWGDGGEVLSLL